MSLGFYIRPALPSDVLVLQRLIYDLAVYEKAPESAKATPELLHHNLFVTEYAHALLAFTGTVDAPGEAVGLALYFFNYSTWTGRPGLYLEDLFVKPEFRNLGIGKAFFAELGKVAEEKKCARMDWTVLKWNKPSIDFYEQKLGAIAMSDWLNMRLNEDGIIRLREFDTTRQGDVKN